MAAKSTALTLSAAATTKRRLPRIQPQNVIMQQAAHLWSTLDATTQGQWQDFADSQSDPTVKNVGTKGTAYGQFYIQNNSLLSAGASPITTPPAARPDQPLPPTQLQITYSGPAPILHLAPNVAYPHPLIVMGAKPLYAGQNVYTKGAFKKIGSLPGLTVPTDITNLYLSRFRLPTSGYQVALKLIGVLPGGYRTAPLFVAAIALQDGYISIVPLTME